MKLGQIATFENNTIVLTDDRYSFNGNPTAVLYLGDAIKRAGRDPMNTTFIVGEHTAPDQPPHRIFIGEDAPADANTELFELEHVEFDPPQEGIIKLGDVATFSDERIHPNTDWRLLTGENPELMIPIVLHLIGEIQAREMEWRDVTMLMVKYQPGTSEPHLVYISTFVGDANGDVEFTLVKEF